MIKHLALIMDGNRRWARAQGLSLVYGHQEGVESIKRAIDFCLTKKIAYLSLYTFSLENFNRSFVFASFCQRFFGSGFLSRKKNDESEH